MNPLDVLMQFLADNVFFLVIVGLLGYLAYMYLRVKRTTLTKPINRSEIERMKFIERMKHNKTESFKWLFRGKNRVGKITHFREYFTNPDNYKVAEIVVKPCLLWRLTNPFSKSQAFMVNMGKISEEKKDFVKEDVIKMIKIQNDGFPEKEVPLVHLDKEYIIRNRVITDGDKLIVPEWISFDHYFGIFHDATLPEEHMKIIKRDDVIRTDLNELASIYYCKSQEQSTFDPIRAHQLALEEKKLEIELAKARGKAETV